MEENRNRDCLSLVKQYVRQARTNLLKQEQPFQIEQILVNRINTGIAHRKLFHFLNRLTNGVIICRYTDFRHNLRIDPPQIQPGFLLYEHVIEGALTPESVAYLLQALQSTCAERTTEIVYQSPKRLLSEDTEEETGPDQCGHINRRISYYHTYAVETHYKLRRPLVEKARTQLAQIADHYAEHQLAIDNALQISHAQEQRGEFGIEVRKEEMREFDHLEIIGDSGYW